MAEETVSKDVEMKDVEGGEEKSEKEEASGSQQQKDKNLLIFEDVREQLRLVEWGVSQREPRFISRAVRNFQSLRKKINERVLWRIVVVYYPPGSPSKETLLGYLEEAMQ